MRLGLGLGFNRLRGGFNPVSALFSASEPGGLWLPEPQYLYQDRAGTTPVTAAGQSVGYRLDISGRGNHLTAINDAARGTYGIEPLGGRRNLLTYTEQFDNAAWAKTRSVVNANAAVAPDGTTTADRLADNSAGGTNDISISFNNITVATASQYTFSVYAKADQLSWIQLATRNFTTPGAGGTYFDIGTGAVGTVQAGHAASILSVGDGWYRCSIRFTTDAVDTLGDLQIYPADGNGDVSVDIDGTSTVFIWGAQLETAASATAYQRVVTAFDVTEAGVTSLGYVSYDGVNSGYVSPTITPGVDKAQVFAGVRKLSDAATGHILETSVSSTVNNGSIFLRGPVTSAATNYGFRSRGTSTAEVAATPFAAPNTSILTGIGDIAADTCIIRVNGVQAATTAADQGTDNYLAYPLYVGRRAGTTEPFNGRDYGILVRFGPNLDADTISRTETWLNQRTGAY